MNTSARLLTLSSLFVVSFCLSGDFSQAQNVKSGSVTSDSAHVEGQIDQNSGHLDGRVITESSIVDGYINLGLQQLGGTVQGRKGNLSGELDYGTGQLRGRINGQEFYLDINSIKQQIRQIEYESQNNRGDRAARIIGIVNAIVQSTQRDKEAPSPDEVSGEPTLAPIPDDNFNPVLDENGSEEYSTKDAPPEPERTVLIKNATARKMNFHLKTNDSEWIPISLEPSDQLELDGNQELTIRFKTDQVYTYSLKTEDTFRFKETDGEVKFFSFNPEKEKPAKPPEPKSPAE